MSRPIRIACAVGALVVCAWFALGVREAQQIDRATNIVGGLNGQQKLTATEAAHARSLLSSASLLNPDQQVNVLRARVALLRNQRPLAVRILRGVVSSEPDNLAGWYGIATSASSGATVNRALAQIRRLEPVVGTH
jgi:predicted Zn-dependent protease